MKSPPRALHDAISDALGRPTVLIGHGEDISSAPGAYLVIAGLSADLVVTHKRFKGQVFAAGWYAYAGSARGPGGMRGRVARHLRRDKALRWHIDWVSDRANSLHAICLPGKTECDLVRVLLASDRFKVPVPGFGSSDCRICPAHFLQWSGA